MGAAESPDRKRRRHDSRERYSSRERRPEGSRERSRERGSYRGRDEDGRGRHKHSEQDRSERDRPASTSGRSHHDSKQQDSSRQECERHAEPLNGSRGGSSRQQEHETRDRHRDRQADRSRDRSREWHREDRDRDRDRDRQRGSEQERERDKDGDRGRYEKGSSRDAGHREDRVAPRRGDREGGYDDRGRDGGPGQQRERADDPPRQREHQQQRDGRGAGGSGGRGHHQQQQRGGSESEGKPKWGKPEDWAADEAPPPGPPKEAPNMGLSGKLAAETNKTADGTAELKFQAPAEARVCKKPVWKLFVYKGSDLTGDPINLTQLPFYLFGKDRKVADIPTDHPSCSRQHAVIVFREVQADAPDGIGYVHTIKPYLLDLETTNGTTINNERLEGARYYELLTGDVIRFGFSSRDYVIMNESVVQ